MPVVKKTTRLSSSPLRLERETLRHLSGGDLGVPDIDLTGTATPSVFLCPLPRPSRGSVSSVLEPGPTSITCPPTKVGGGGGG